jgi:hypothetical protein
MKSQSALWFTNPSLKTVLLFASLWFIGNALLVLAITDFFSQSFFASGHYLSILMMIMSTIQTGKLVRNYLRTRTSSN